MRKSKFDNLVAVSGGVANLVNKINKEVEEGKSLTVICNDLGLSRSSLSIGLKKLGYKYKDGEYTPEEDNKVRLTEEEKELLLLGKFTQQVSFKTEEGVLKEFQELSKELFPNLAISKCYTLALKLFVDKYKIYKEEKEGI